jgi:phosphoglycolate phosphatase-like HAD superfamily hydrolase
MTVGPSHVLFDLDGTLVDSRDAVVSCYAKVLHEKLGRAFPPPEISDAEVFAMRPRELFDQVAPGRGDELHEAYCAAYPSHAALVKTFEGARELVLGLAEMGRFPSLVTNKGRDRALLDLERLDLDPSAFACIVTAEETPGRKPDPAPILLGLRRAGGRAADAIYVGDGPQDLEASRAAGMPAIAVTYGFYDRPALAPLGPRHIVDSVEELASVLGVSLRPASRS